MSASNNLIQVEPFTFFYLVQSHRQADESQRLRRHRRQGHGLPGQGPRGQASHRRCNTGEVRSHSCYFLL